MYDVCGNGRRPLGLVACGLLPQHTERGTVLQTATRSVLQCKVLQPQNQVAFFSWMQRERMGRWIKVYHACSCPVCYHARRYWPGCWVGRFNWSVICTRKFEIGNLLLMGEIFGNWVIPFRCYTVRSLMNYAVILKLYVISSLYHTYITNFLEGK